MVTRGEMQGSARLSAQLLSLLLILGDIATKQTKGVTIESINLGYTYPAYIR
jgi:hypothetical protein